MNLKRDMDDMQQPDLEALAFEKETDTSDEGTKKTEHTIDHDVSDVMDQPVSAKSHDNQDKTETLSERRQSAKKDHEDEAKAPDWMKRFESMPYEEAVKSLEKIVSRLESSDLSLDESVTLFQQGMHLARICAGRLNEIEGKITKMIETEQEKMEEVPLDLD